VFRIELTADVPQIGGRAGDAVLMDQAAGTFLLQRKAVGFHKLDARECAALAEAVQQMDAEAFGREP
jgi:hypothetical protein